MPDFLTLAFRFAWVLLLVNAALIALSLMLAQLGGVRLPVIFHLLPPVLAGADAGVQVVRKSGAMIASRPAWQLSVRLMGVALGLAALIAMGAGVMRGISLIGPTQFLIALTLYAAIVTALIRFFLGLGAKSEAKKRGYL